MFREIKHESPNNFKVLDSISDIHKGSTKFSSKQVSKEVSPLSSRKQTILAPSKPTRFHWVGLMPKNLLVTDLLQENSKLKYVKIGRLDKVKNVVLVDPTACEFNTNVKPFLNPQIIWIQVLESEGYSRISEVKMVKKEETGNQAKKEKREKVCVVNQACQEMEAKKE